MRSGPTFNSQGIHPPGTTNAMQSIQKLSRQSVGLTWAWLKMIAAQRFTYMLSEPAVNVHIFTVFCLILWFNGNKNAALVHLLSKTLAKKQHIKSARQKRHCWNKQVCRFHVLHPLSRRSDSICILIKVCELQLKVYLATSGDSTLYSPQNAWNITSLKPPTTN